MTSPARFRAIAEEWRQSRPQAGRLSGVVLIDGESICGWLLSMQYASAQPGLVAVDDADRVFVAAAPGHRPWGEAWIELTEVQHDD